MKLLVGIVIGSAGMWLYSSQQVRERARRGASGAPEPLKKVGQTVAAGASSSAQRMSGVIDTAPLPARVKDVAARVTGGGAHGTGSQAAAKPDYIGTPGVESASGRGRTAPGGDLPADPAQP